MSLLLQIHKKAQAKHAKRPFTIVLAEAEDARVISAAAIIEQQRIANLILIGNKKKIDAIAEKAGVTLHATVLEPEENNPLDNPLDLAAAMVAQRKADTFIGGNISSTADTIRSAIKNIGVNGFASSYFLMIEKETEDEAGKKCARRAYIFTDCAFNIAPNEQQLVSIAYNASVAAQELGMQASVAFLSFSTAGSARHELAYKTQRTTQLFKQEHPDIPALGEIQFDAAYDLAIAQQKGIAHKDTPPTTVFVFADLASANIGYKIAERIGGARAIGPLFAGFKRPFADLSRGCSAQDIVDVAAVLGAQNKEN